MSTKISSLRRAPSSSPARISPAANSEAAQLKAIRIAKKHGRKVVFDVDYRPNLWGLAGHAEGFERYVKSDLVSAKMRQVLPDCDLIVGTEEEIMIASGADDVLGSLKAIRAVSKAAIVLKRGAKGCIVYDGPISDDLEDGIVGEGFPIEVYNVLGAGDAFMSGLLRGWLGGESFETAATWANACGAFAVSRLLCAPEYPTFEELQFFLKNGSKHHALRKDEAINHIHWATTRRERRALADGFRLRPPRAARGDRRARRRGREKDRGVQGAGRKGRRKSRQRARRLRHAARREIRPQRHVRIRQAQVCLARPAGRAAGLAAAAFRVQPGHRLAARGMAGRPLHQMPVLLPSGRSAALKQEQQEKLRALFDASRKVGRELLVEIIAGKHGKLDDNTVPRALEELYALGIKPDWWKLEPQASPSAWAGIEAVITENDPWCRGVVLLGLDAPQDELEAAFAATAKAPVVKGFAVGRTIFADAAEKWLGGQDVGRGGGRRHGAALREPDRSLACRARPEGGIRKFEAGAFARPKGRAALQMEERR